MKNPLVISIISATLFCAVLLSISSCNNDSKDSVIPGNLNCDLSRVVQLWKQPTTINFDSTVANFHYVNGRVSQVDFLYNNSLTNIQYNTLGKLTYLKNQEAEFRIIYNDKNQISSATYDSLSYAWTYLSDGTIKLVDDIYEKGTDTSYYSYDNNRNVIEVKLLRIDTYYTGKDTLLYTRKTIAYSSLPFPKKLNTELINEYFNAGEIELMDRDLQTKNLPQSATTYDLLHNNKPLTEVVYVYEVKENGDITKMTRTFKDLETNHTSESTTLYYYGCE